MLCNINVKAEWNYNSRGSVKNKTERKMTKKKTQTEMGTTGTRKHQTKQYGTSRSSEIGEEA
jgi:hypothetical protein